MSWLDASSWFAEVKKNYCTQSAMSFDSHSGLPGSGAPGTSNLPSVDNSSIPPDNPPVPVASSTSTSTTIQLPTVTTTGNLSGASAMLSPIQLQQIAGAVANILHPGFSTANPLATTAPSLITMPVTGSSEGIYSIDYIRACGKPLLAL